MSGCDRSLQKNPVNFSGIIAGVYKLILLTNIPCIFSELLSYILESFRRFRGLLKRYDLIRNDYYDYREKRYQESLTEWLNEIEIELCVGGDSPSVVTNW